MISLVTYCSVVCRMIFHHNLSVTSNCRHFGFMVYIFLFFSSRNFYLFGNCHFLDEICQFQLFVETAKLSVFGFVSVINYVFFLNDQFPICFFYICFQKKYEKRLDSLQQIRRLHSSETKRPSVGHSTENTVRKLTVPCEIRTSSTKHAHYNKNFRNGGREKEAKARKGDKERIPAISTTETTGRLYYRVS